MARGVNKVIIVGTLGADPDTSYAPNETAITKLSIATNESWKNKGGALVEHTEWHNLIAWGKLAEFGIDFLYKGQLVSIEGSLRTRTWEDKGEKAHKITEILCASIIPLEWKKEDIQTK